MTTPDNTKLLVDRILNNPVQFRKASGNVKKDITDTENLSYIMIGKSNAKNVVQYKNNGDSFESNSAAKPSNAGYEKKRKIPSSVAEALDFYTKAALGETKKKKKTKDGNDIILEGKREDEDAADVAKGKGKIDSHQSSDSSDSDVFHEANEYADEFAMSTGRSGEDLGEDIGEDVGEDVVFDSSISGIQQTYINNGNKSDEKLDGVPTDQSINTVHDGNNDESNLANRRKLPKGVNMELKQLQRDNQDYEREQEMIKEIQKAREEERRLAEEAQKISEKKKRGTDELNPSIQKDEDNGELATTAGMRKQNSITQDGSPASASVGSEDRQKKIKTRKHEKAEIETGSTMSSKISSENEESSRQVFFHNEDVAKEHDEVLTAKKSETPPTVLADISEFYQLEEDFDDRGCIASSPLRKNWGARYIPKRPKGLLNHGVTCYTNAAVQALIHIPAVQHYLDEISCNKHPNIGTNTISHVLAETTQRLWGHDGKKSSYINPRKLITRLEDINCMMSEWQQEDSHEYFMSLMSRLQEDSVPKGHKMTESIIYDIFGGLLKQTVKCNSCGGVSTTEQPFYDLSLHLKGKKTTNDNDENEKKELKTARYSIEKSIRDFFNAELIRIDKEKKGYVCEKCKETTNAIKESCILRAPETLLVHLKKFRFNGTSSSKMKQAVSYPMFLDITEFCERTGTVLPVKYQLLSVVVHEGRSLSSGHYIAHCRQPDGSWATYDDEYINKITEREVLKERNAYYVLYTRLTPKSLKKRAMDQKIQPKEKSNQDLIKTKNEQSRHKKKRNDSNTKKHTNRNKKRKFNR